MEHPQHIVFDFTGTSATCRAKLLWDDAPKTCEAIVRLLPTDGNVHQAVYSGSESVTVLGSLLRLDAENATSNVQRGDVAFTWLAAGSAYGVTRDFSEICWFYDHDAQPRMWEGPVDVNVFGKIIEPADEFYIMCRRIRREGIKAIRIDAG